MTHIPLRFFQSPVFVIFVVFSAFAQAGFGSELIDAVKSADYAKVDQLIAAGANLEEVDPQGLTALYHAVDVSDTAMARTLIEAQALIPQQAMLALAYRHRDAPTISLLLNAGVDANVNAPGSETKLAQLAVEDGATHIAKRLLNAGAEISSAYMEQALGEGKDEVVTFCLANGYDPRQTLSDGRTVLQFVLDEDRHHLVLPVLMAHDAEPSKEPWLSRAIRNGNAEISLALLAADFPIGNGKAADGHTLLGWAIAHEMDEVAERLIDAGVDVNQVERAPATSLFRKKFTNSDSLQWILKVDSKINALMLVAAKGNHSLAQTLKRAGALNRPSRKYNYAVSIASNTDDVRMMQILMGRNPDASPQPRRLVVDLSEQRVWLYEGGKMTHSAKCSTGKRGHETRTGEFVITQKRKSHVSNIYWVSMPNFMRLSCSDFGFHTGVCPGYPASKGCIRLPDATAVKLFQTCSLGDLVVIRP